MYNSIGNYALAESHESIRAERLNKLHGRINERVPVKIFYQPYTQTVFRITVSAKLPDETRIRISAGQFAIPFKIGR